MFDRYYDTVEYEAAGGSDKSGNPIYQMPKQVNVRFVKGGEVQTVAGDRIITQYKRVYHTPFEVKQGDKLDGHLVTDVKPSRDISGQIYFYIVGTV